MHGVHNVALFTIGLLRYTWKLPPQSCDYDWSKTLPEIADRLRARIVAEGQPSALRVPQFGWRARGRSMMDNSSDGFPEIMKRKGLIKHY